MITGNGALEEARVAASMKLRAFELIKGPLDLMRNTCNSCFSTARETRSILWDILMKEFFTQILK